ncbi:hypothetical protein CQ018_14900 [Arthrobacter sp. MYb227]|uniref:hypothetical protein n=1 Tax=Arthrobacter sp. MYb227 TaxID=1848601 RepID=UPI000D4951A5|nr:hypothetical protein [Arthrobacter sp. MYb227]PQZ90279.1 hypothetical protein CQ018_14900 [Arthrobacter sp. MYb227]
MSQAACRDTSLVVYSDNDPPIGGRIEAAMLFRKLHRTHRLVQAIDLAPGMGGHLSTAKRLPAMLLVAPNANILVSPKAVPTQYQWLSHEQIFIQSLQSRH